MYTWETGLEYIDKTGALGQQILIRASFFLELVRSVPHHISGIFRFYK